MTLGFGLLSAQLRPGEQPDWERAYDETIRVAEHADEPLRVQRQLAAALRKKGARLLAHAIMSAVAQDGR